MLRQAGAGQPRLLGGRELVHDVLELDDALGLLAELRSARSPSSEARGRLVALRPLLQQLVEVSDGFFVFLLRVEALGDPVLGVVGQIGVGVGDQVLLEALDRQRVAPLVVVGVRRVVELGRAWMRARGRPARRSRRLPGVPEGGFWGGTAAPAAPAAAAQRSPWVSAICCESWASRRFVSSSFDSSCSIFAVSSRA